MNTKIQFKLIILLLIPIFTFGQFGPGGVGNSTNNGLWLRADGLTSYANNDLVNEWIDFSGNSNDAINTVMGEQPEFILSSPINMRPALYFDGVLDQMIVDDHPLLDNTPGFTFYSVVRPDNLDNAPRGIMGKRITQNTTVEYAYTFFFWNSRYLNLDVHTQNNRFTTSPVNYNNNTNYMAGFTFDGTLPSASRSKVYEAGNLVRVASESSTSLPNSAQDFCIGGLNKDYDNGGQKRLGGYFAEMVQYNFTLNEAQRIIVENYLGAKYNITIANDYFNYEGSHAGEVAGIGRIDASNFHDDSQGSAIVRINSPANLNDGEFLIWGHNELPLTQNDVVDVDGVVIETRLERVWRATETGDVGLVTISFDVSDLGPIVPTDLRLLIDRNHNGFFDNDVPPMSGFFSGNTITFTGVDLRDADFFTLGSINIIQSPLPIELLDFTVSKQGRTALLEWSTASEVNNDYFDIERSKDGINFHSFDKVDGAGNSSTLKTYNLTDEAPFIGTSYYRLKQVDFNGDFTYSQIRSISLEDNINNSIQVVPSPNNGKFSVVILGPCNIDRIAIYDLNGKLCFEEFKPMSIKQSAELSYKLDLNFGVYNVKVFCESGKSLYTTFIVK